MFGKTQLTAVELFRNKNLVSKVPTMFPELAVTLRPHTPWGRLTMNVITALWVCGRFEWLIYDVSLGMLVDNGAA
jgi:hypothetical protein